MGAAFDLHPEMQGLVAAKQKVSGAPASKDLRDAWNSYGDSMQRPYPADMVVEDRLLETPGCGRALTPVRIYRPAAVRETAAPCVLYVHGGSFVKGSLDSGDAIAWGIADQVPAVVVSIDYRLAPEHPFPAAVEDCYAVLQTVAANAATLGVDSERIGVWGDSAGGGLSAGLCLLARDRNGPRIAAQALNYPMLTDELTSDAYRTYAESPGAQTASLDACWSLYLGERRPTDDPYAAPLKARDLAGLPPAHVHIAEIDPLADDGRRYAQRLEQAGCTVELRVARRMIHGFLRARFFGPDSSREFAQPCAFLARWLRAAHDSTAISRSSPR
ncbi:MAG TPA: alpha/beta hydrolase [Burkholderiales bacterium]|nr:alpha/beta hydrolase [Burkholderiales bacterium]